MNDNDLQETPPTPPAGEKLQKVLARIGVGSRRDVEAWIGQGRIKVNGVVATLGQRVDLHDAIAVDGKLIKRWATKVTPDDPDDVAAIESALPKP